MEATESEGGIARAHPLVSVITPTFRRPELLATALKSAMAQNFRDFEVIVSDNDSSEEVAALVAGLEDPRLRYRHNGSNIGALENAVAALREARGRYVAFLHDDDSWEPEFLERLVPPLESDPSLALAYCDHFLMDADGFRDEEATRISSALWGREGAVPGVRRPFVVEAVLERSVPIAMGSLIRRGAVDWNDFPGGIGTIYDLWIAYHACRDGQGAYYTPERLTNYRIHGGAITSSTRYDRQFVFCYDQFLSDPRLAPWSAQLESIRSTFRTGLALTLLAEGGQRREAVALLVQSLQTRPTSRAVVGLGIALLPRHSLQVVRAVKWALSGRRVDVRA